MHAAPESVKAAISVTTAGASDFPGRAVIYAIIITVRHGIATRNRVQRKWEYPRARQRKILILSRPYGRQEQTSIPAASIPVVPTRITARENVRAVSRGRISKLAEADIRNQHALTVHDSNRGHVHTRGPSGMVEMKKTVASRSRRCTAKLSNALQRR